MSNLDSYFTVAGTFVGTKQIEAVPVTRGEYNLERGWTISADEDPSEEGYMVRYPDGYISWSPKPQFDEAYQSAGMMNFSSALFLLKSGIRVCRHGWNGADMFIFLVPGSQFNVNREPLLGIYEEGTPIDYWAHIDMKAADGRIGPWVASQTDLLAEDWCLYS